MTRTITIPADELEALLGQTTWRAGSGRQTPGEITSGEITANERLALCEKVRNYLSTKARPHLPLETFKVHNPQHTDADKDGYVTGQDAPNWWYEVFYSLHGRDNPTAGVDVLVDPDSGVTVVHYETWEYEPGQWDSTEWTVIVDPTTNTVTFASRDGSQVYMVVYFDQLDDNVVNEDTTQLVRVLKYHTEYVPQAGSPNQPDTPSLQDMYPNHPSFTEG